MNKPKMILFDYGHTLLYEPGFDFLRGETALFKYIKSNPRNITPEQLNEPEKRSRGGDEMPEWVFGGDGK